VSSVLVRNLYSSTLNAVGTGCTFAKGDVRELSSLYDAMENVDKVIWAVGASNSQETESVEFNGLQNVIKALHDSKFQQYGSEEVSTDHFVFHVDPFFMLLVGKSDVVQI